MTTSDNAVLLNFIDGRWLAGSSGRSVDNLNPANRSDLIGRVATSTEGDVDDAAERAHAALPAWGRRTAIERGRILLRAAQVLAGRKRQVAEDLTREEGKTLREAEAEVSRAIGVLEYYAGLSWGPTGSYHPSERPDFRIQVRREPLGVIAVVTPWNFPIAIPAWKIAPALIAGNTVVFKPASLTPLTAVNLVRAFDEAGLPPGVLNLVLGSGDTVGHALAKHDLVRGVSFTGSTAVGRALGAAASLAGKRIQAELGGHNAVVVLADADLDQATQIVADGAFAQTGQRCTATRRVIVEAPVYDTFLDRLVNRARQLRVGDPTIPETDIGPVVSNEQLALDLAAVDQARADGGVVAVGGDAIMAGACARGSFLAPTVITRVAPRAAIAQTEVFGPILSVFPVDGLAQAIDLANATDYGLSAAICTRDLDRAEAFIAQSQSGVVAVNAPTAGMEVQVPIHGRKGSGLGLPEQGVLALDFCTEVKTVYYRFGAIQ